MKIHYIVETDLISKALAIAPTIASKEDAPTISSILNLFGDIHMRIRATLDPIDLIYFLETKHQIVYESDESELHPFCEIDLTIGDIFYHLPQMFFEYIYLGKSEMEIFTDDILCELLAQSFSNDAQRRFANNKYVDITIGDDGIFDGYTMNMIGISNTTSMIPPITPTNPLQEELQSNFEQALRERVTDAHNMKSFIDVFGVFTKRISYSDLIYNITHNVNIDTINCSIYSLIRDKIIPENMYTVTKVKNLLGNEHETIEFDRSMVNHVIETVAMIPVTIRVINRYDCKGDAPILVGYTNIFQRYLDDIMLENIQSIFDDFPHKEMNINETMQLYAHDYQETVNTIYEDMNTSDMEEESNDLDVSLLDDDNTTDDSISIDTEDDAFSLLQNIVDTMTDTDDIEDDSIVDENQHVDEEIVAKDESSDNTNKYEIMPREFSFFVSNASFDSIAMIEKNSDYHAEGTIGIVAMDYENGIPSTYMIGIPQHYDIDDMIRFRWEVMDYNKLFNSDSQQNIAYKVHDWYDKDKIIANDVLWVDYHNYIEGDDVNVKTAKR